MDFVFSLHLESLAIWTRTGEDVDHFSKRPSSHPLKTFCIYNFKFETDLQSQLTNIAQECADMKAKEAELTRQVTELTEQLEAQNAADESSGLQEKLEQAASRILDLTQDLEETQLSYVFLLF